MKTIRRCVFETNSSSTHSIVISGKNKLSDLNCYDRIVYAKFGEYGWGIDHLCLPLEKLNYVLTAIQYYDKEIDNVKDLKESIYFKQLNEMVKETIDCEIEIIENGDGFYSLGYIDHQSIDILDEFWSEDKTIFKNNMKELIFNNKYKIIIDNDNH